MSRADLDGLVAEATELGAKGLVWAVLEADGWRSPVAKFLSADEIAAANEALGASEGDVVLLVADDPLLSAEVLGELRRRLGERLGLIDPEANELTWIVDWPLLGWAADEERWDPHNHPFTSPDGDFDPAIRAPPGPRPTTSSGTDGKLVGARSVSATPRCSERCSRRSESTSRRPRTASASSSTRCATAPRRTAASHTGSTGSWRCSHGTDSIRDVIAFPKTASGADPLTGAPGPGRRRASFASWGSP